MMSKLPFFLILLMVNVSVFVQTTCIAARYVPANVWRWFQNLKTHMSCPGGWVTYKGSGYCYRSANKPTTRWNEARKACLAMGGDLVKITSAQKNSYVALLARTNSSSNSLMWIGLVGDSNNKFTWVDGSALSSGQYSNWNAGEPNNYNGRAEDCGMMYLRSMKWNDALCDHSVRMTYMCEKERIV